MTDGSRVFVRPPVQPDPDAEAKVRNALASNRTWTAGELVVATGLTWGDVDDGLAAMGAEASALKTHPERFVLTRYL